MFREYSCISNFFQITLTPLMTLTLDLRFLMIDEDTPWNQGYIDGKYDKHWFRGLREDREHTDTQIER